MDIDDLCSALRCEPLHQRVRAIRQELSASQQQLADYCGVDQAAISRLEQGQDALLSTWIKVLAGLGCELTIRMTSAEDEERDHHVQENIRRRDNQQKGLSETWVRGRRR